MQATCIGRGLTPYSREASTVADAEPADQSAHALHTDHCTGPRERCGGDTDQGGDVCNTALHPLRPARWRRRLPLQRRAGDRSRCVCKIILVMECMAYAVRSTWSSMCPALNRAQMLYTVHQLVARVVLAAPVPPSGEPATGVAKLQVHIQKILPAGLHVKPQPELLCFPNINKSSCIHQNLTRTATTPKKSQMSPAALSAVCSAVGQQARLPVHILVHILVRSYCPGNMNKTSQCISHYLHGSACMFVHGAGFPSIVSAGASSGTQRLLARK